MKGKPVEQTVREIIDYLKAITIKSVQGGRIKESRQGTTITIPRIDRPEIPPDRINPFYPTLEGTAEDGYLLTMARGYVICRKKKTGEDAVEVFEPTDLPDETPVVVGDQISCKLTESAEGVITAAEIVIGTWADSLAPELKGGDNPTGTPGTRYIRLCEIVQETDLVEVKIWNTGHIDHFSPELHENMDNSGARVMKKFFADEMRWKYRTILAGDNITVTENADDIEISTTASGPNGLWGTTLWSVYNQGTNASTLTHTYENGVLVNVGVEGSDAAYTGAGTQADPYEAVISSIDTDT